METNSQSRLSLPAAESLPPTDATLPQIIRFARTADPTAHFLEHWGKNYQTQVRALWDRYVTSYQAGEETQGSAEELLMCLVYDIALGPYLGVPEPSQRSFLLWLIDGVRRALQSSEG